MVNLVGADRWYGKKLTLANQDCKNREERNGILCLTCKIMNSSHYESM